MQVDLSELSFTDAAEQADTGHGCTCLQEPDSAGPPGGRRRELRDPCRVAAAATHGHEGHRSAGSDPDRFRADLRHVQLHLQGSARRKRRPESCPRGGGLLPAGPATVFMVGRVRRPTERPGRRAGRSGPGARGDRTGHGRGSLRPAVRGASARVAGPAGELGARTPRIRLRQCRKLDAARPAGDPLLRARVPGRPRRRFPSVVVCCVPGGYAGYKLPSNPAR